MRRQPARSRASSRSRGGSPQTLSLSAATVWLGFSYSGAIVGYLAVNAFAARLLQNQFGYFVIAVSASTVIGQLGLFGAHRGGLREAARLESGDTDGLLDLRRAVRAVSAITLPLIALISGLCVFFLMNGASHPRQWAVAAAWASWFGSGASKSFGRITYGGSGVSDSRASSREGRAAR